MMGELGGIEVDAAKNEHPPVPTAHCRRGQPTPLRALASGLQVAANDIGLDL